MYKENDESDSNEIYDLIDKNPNRYKRIFDNKNIKVSYDNITTELNKNKNNLEQNKKKINNTTSKNENFNTNNNNNLNTKTSNTVRYNSSSKNDAFITNNNLNTKTNNNVRYNTNTDDDFNELNLRTFISNNKKPIQNRNNKIKFKGHCRSYSSNMYNF